MTSKHRHVGCQSRGKRLECCAQILIWVTVSAEKASTYLNLAIILKEPNEGVLRAFYTDTFTQNKI